MNFMVDDNKAEPQLAVGEGKKLRPEDVGGGNRLEKSHARTGGGISHKRDERGRPGSGLVKERGNNDNK